VRKVSVENFLKPQRYGNAGREKVKQDILIDFLQKKPAKIFAGFF
jgi:hypothetical protein